MAPFFSFFGLPRICNYVLTRQLMRLKRFRSSPICKWHVCTVVDNTTSVTSTSHLKHVMRKTDAPRFNISSYCKRETTISWRGEKHTTHWRYNMHSSFNVFRTKTRVSDLHATSSTHSTDISAPHCSCRFGVPPRR